MNNENRQALVRYRLAAAQETLSDAKLLLNSGGSLRSVCNRVYYAMFYAALGLLESKGLASSKHSGVIALFNKEFVHTGVMDRKYSKTLQNMFVLRQNQDYRLIEPPSKERLEQLMEEAREFIDAARDVLKL